MTSLQWGGRFSEAPDDALLQFGTSLAEDLVLAPFDVACSLAHVVALREGGVLSAACAAELNAALDAVAAEIAQGTFSAFARASGAEDIHGAIDARVRQLAPDAGASLHAGRSRNDQVATTLLLYCADRLQEGVRVSLQIAQTLAQAAREHLDRETLMAGTTHWQPAQPVLLAFWLCAAAEPFVRDAKRLSEVKTQTMRSCPLGSCALAGSSLPLDRSAAAAALGFMEPARNAMDAVGSRDAALDAAHALLRTVLDASRVCEELVIWCTPAFGYARLGDAASTGSSLMPQKRNPDPLELVRATSAVLVGEYAGALASVSGVALSYHRDLQLTKAAILTIVERGLAALRAFARALPYVEFNAERMTASAGAHGTVATDVADRLIAQGMSARSAHAQVGRELLQSEKSTAPPAWPDALASVKHKVTAGSTAPQCVTQSLAALQRDIAEMQR
jgi:argininosuccinate lyase